MNNVMKFDSKNIFSTISEWIKNKPDTAEDIAPDNLFVDVGMESADAVELAEYLSKEFDNRVDVSLIWDYPEIESFCDALAEVLNEEEQETINHDTTPSEGKKDIKEMDNKSFLAMLEDELS